MISVQTDLPVYSNARGSRNRQERKMSPKKEERNLARGQRIEERKFARGQRKAKRNAKRLVRVTRKNGRKVFVYPLTKLRPVSKFSGSNGQTTIAPIVPASTEYLKTFPDGTTVNIPASRVIVHSTGVYDKNDIAKIFNVDPTTLNQTMIDAYIVGMPAASQNATTANEADKNNPNNATGLIVDDTKVVMDENGNPYVDNEVLKEGEPDKDIKDEDKPKMSNTQKYLLVGGAVLVGGLLIYYFMNKGKSGK
jgi:hypothetical protein